LDLNRSDGTKHEAVTSLGDDFTGAKRGVMQYEDASTGWEPTSDWDAQSGPQSLHQLRIADRAAQASEQVNGVRFHMPPGRPFSFHETIAYEGTQYVAVEELLDAEGAREVLAFDLHNFATDVPTEYVRMIYREGFRPPREPQMRVETSEITENGERFGVVKLYPNHPFAVEKVEAKALSGFSGSGFAELTAQGSSLGGIYYEAQVKLVEGRFSHIQPRVTWRQAGTETLGLISFDFDAQPEMVSAQLFLNDSGQVLLSALGETDTAEIAWAAQKGAYPSDYDDADATTGTVSGRKAEDVYVGDLGAGAVMHAVVRGRNGSLESPLVRRQIARALDVRWPISELQESPLGITYRITVGTFDVSVTLQTMVQFYDTSDNAQTVALPYGGNLTSDGEVTVDLAKQSDQAQRAKIWLENKETGVRVTEHKWRPVPRRPPTIDLQGSRNDTSAEDMVTATLGRSVRGAVVGIADVGGEPTTEKSGETNPVTLRGTETTQEVVFNVHQTSQSTTYQAWIRYDGLTRNSDLLTLPDSSS